ncbi:hypothetical protein A3SI_15236 [Nitritalea halalkaliphila LW7]|uniref:Uncharacterized protein n=1 Tax=Nitritalea halalkaliphila LW7 TaxID=1189621 RepID=I5BYZ2_9BACT|nr:hypothetical protein [Nitritalea halalkaliphila]EIM74794.1 hypothetical protein A3SI_15236 [Nitritalea halalkaliphila LW7]
MRVAVPQGTSLQFAQIEIPINMRYKVLDRREGGFFIAGGVSHMMYANQQATATFAVPNFNAQGVEASSMSETFTNTFSPDTDSGAEMVNSYSSRWVTNRT